MPSDNPAAERTADQCERTVVGWREWVGIPGIGLRWIKAKVDTGAKTSSLHAFDLEVVTKEDGDWVRFEVHPWQSGTEDPVQVEVPVHDKRLVRSSSGHADERYVVLLDLELAGRSITAEVTLADRDVMGFRMLIGREALAQGYLVDPGISYAGRRPPRALRRKNWGKGPASSPREQA